MESFWKNIISNKANPVYWPMLLILLIVSIFYRIGLKINNTFKVNTIRTKAKVISVGNLTVGGTGKTPVTIFLANYFINKKKKVGIVSSGYGRQIKNDICETGQTILQKDIRKTGDELMEMAGNLPDVCFSVANSKTEAAIQLEKKYQVDIIIIDDGFQHRKLFRSLDILLIDANHDLRHESVFPLGNLREKLSAINRADMIFMTKANYRKDEKFSNWLRTQFPDKTLAEIYFINDSLVSDENEILIDEISKQNSYFFAGIGNFKGLLNYLSQNLPNLKYWRQFEDHCQYNRPDIDKIKKDLEKYQPEFIITTYKDYVKLKSFDFGKTIYYLKLRVELKELKETVFAKLDKITEITEN